MLIIYSVKGRNMKKHPCMKNSKAGFTLIEVVLVVVIIGILATITVPSVFGVLNSANHSVDNARAGLYESALRIYVSQKAQVREYVYIADTHGEQGLVANSIAHVIGERTSFDAKTRNWVFYYHPRTLQVVAMEYGGLETLSGMIALVKNAEGAPEQGEPDGALLEATP